MLKLILYFFSLKDTKVAWGPSKIDPVGVGEISTASTSPGSTEWSSRTLEERLGVSGEESEDAKTPIDDDADNDENEQTRGQE